MMYSTLKIHAILILTICQVTDAVYCPPYCRCLVTNFLRHVKCIRQNLISVDLDVPTSVQFLELSHNSISELRDFIFQDLGLEKILILNLKYNTINSIGLNAFHGLNQIEFLDITGNHLYRIDPSTFENNPSMVHLILNSNPLRTIPIQKPFLVSSSLTTLEVSHCRFTYFPSESFAALPSLRSLNISNNDVLFLNENILNSLNNLNLLDITNTAIKCDSNSGGISNWAITKSVRIIGNQCSTTADRFSQYNSEKGKTFEKMIMKNDDVYSDVIYSDYDSNNCICPENSCEDDASSNVTNSTPAKETVKTLSQHDYRSMLWLAFLNGFVSGAAISSSAILFWIYCCKYRCRRNNRNVIQTSAQYDTIPSETPPPSYNELF